VASSLGIEFRKINFIEHYREHVVRYLIEGYGAGRTPNPDVLCNRHVKFGILIQYALDQGFSHVATGHYVRSVRDGDGRYTLHEGRDPSKDQSYFLCMIRGECLPKVLFPVGDSLKGDVRRWAHLWGLPNASRKDSQGICFLGSARISINEFLSRYLRDEPGDVVTTDGRVVGHHRGLHRYTLGQRKGIGVPSNSDNNHYVVVEKDFERRRLTVAFESEAANTRLWTHRATIADLNFFDDRPHDGEKLLGRPRYRDPPQIITYFYRDGNRAQVFFDWPQRGLAPGQFLAIYRGTRLLGGGTYVECPPQ
jgi:tRNA-specific 2-thiouridylase